jgi:endonuclease-3
MLFNKTVDKQYIEEIFKRLQKSNPTPKTDLEYTNPYTLMVAVVLSAQSTDKGVNKATPSLFDKIVTPQDMLDFGIENLKQSIKTIGLYNNKAANIIKFSQQLLERHEGIVPSTQEELEALAGIGRKSANVILNVCFKKPFIAVDTHVFRVSHRLKLSVGKNPLSVEKDLINIIPLRYQDKAGHWLVLHGRYTCKAKKPACAICILNDICPSVML